MTDLDFELPLEEYERRRVRLVLGGDPAAIGQQAGAKADYLISLVALAEAEGSILEKHAINVEFTEE